MKKQTISKKNPNQKQTKIQKAQWSIAQNKQTKNRQMRDSIVFQMLHYQFRFLFLCDHDE